jgi:hypothetical protein
MPSDPPAAAARREWWRRRWVKAVVWLILVLIVLHVVERQVGEYAWRRYQEDAARRGVKLRIADYVPPPVPDEENFAAIPHVANPYASIRQSQGQLDWDAFNLPYPAHKRQPNQKELLELDLIDIRDGMVAAGWLDAAGENPATDVLRAMERFAPQMAEIRAAASRPSANFSVKWEEGFAARLSHLHPLSEASRRFGVRARALLALHQSEEALEEWRCIMRIGRSLDRQPAIVCAQVQARIFAMGSAVVEKGIATDAWSDAELKAISEEIGSVDPMAAMRFSLDSERAQFVHFVDGLMNGGAKDMAKFFATKGISREPSPQAVHFFRLLPRGWLRHSQVTYNQIADIQLESGSSAWRRAQEAQEATFLLRRSPVSLYRGFVVLFSFPIVDRFFQWEANLGALRLFCALGRYRKAHGEFPGNLDALVPEWIGAIPKDPMDGQPLRYRRNADGGIDIWSIATNGIDDGGKTDAKLSPYRQPDWIWSIPAK